MKKLFLSLFVAAFTLSIYSCRETTEEKTEEAVEAVGEDMEAAGEEIEQTGEEAETTMEEEVHEEVHETDDMQ